MIPSCWHDLTAGRVIGLIFSSALIGLASWLHNIRTVALNLLSLACFQGGNGLFSDSCIGALAAVKAGVFSPAFAKTIPMRFIGPMVKQVRVALPGRCVAVGLYSLPPASASIVRCDDVNLVVVAVFSVLVDHLSNFPACKELSRHSDCCCGFAHCQIIVPLVKGCPAPLRGAVFAEVVVPALDSFVSAISDEWAAEPPAAAVGAGTGSSVGPAPISDVGIYILVQHGLPSEVAESLKVGVGGEEQCDVRHFVVSCGPVL